MRARADPSVAPSRAGLLMRFPHRRSTAVECSEFNEAPRVERLNGLVIQRVFCSREIGVGACTGPVFQIGCDIPDCGGGNGSYLGFGRQPFPLPRALATHCSKVVNPQFTPSLLFEHHG